MKSADLSPTLGRKCTRVLVFGYYNIRVLKGKVRGGEDVWVRGDEGGRRWYGGIIL